MTKTTIGGSVGKRTDIHSSDIDLIIFFNADRNDYQSDLPIILNNMEKILRGKVMNLI